MILLFYARAPYAAIYADAARLRCYDFRRFSPRQLLLATCFAMRCFRLFARRFFIFMRCFMPCCYDMLRVTMRARYAYATLTLMFCAFAFASRRRLCRVDGYRLRLSPPVDFSALILPLMLDAADAFHFSPPPLRHIFASAPTFAFIFAISFIFFFADADAAAPPLLPPLMPLIAMMLISRFRLLERVAFRHFADTCLLLLRFFIDAFISLRLFATLLL